MREPVLACKKRGVGEKTGRVAPRKANRERTFESQPCLSHSLRAAVTNVYGLHGL